MNNMVDITSLQDRVGLLKALWNRAKPASLFLANGMNPPEFDDDEAIRILGGGRTGYVDYVCGRSIKANLLDNIVDPSSYDRTHGAGAFQDVVDKLSATNYENHSFKDGFGMMTNGKALHDSIVDVVKKYNADQDPKKFNTTMQFLQLMYDLDTSGLSAVDKNSLMKNVSSVVSSFNPNCISKYIDRRLKRPVSDDPWAQ